MLGASTTVLAKVTPFPLDGARYWFRQPKSQAAEGSFSSRDTSKGLSPNL